MTFTKQVLAALFALIILPARAAHCANTYLDMSLEDLMDLTVTSVSKRAQSVQDTAVAVHVLTAEDIRRSGATSIPEALRMVPGLMVAQNNAGVWSVSSRGRSFNPIFENKLLVMIDGRSIYSSFYSGVFWESIDLIMEDIDRIEVIRGPGTSAWGANAVNGIINIITKSSADTQGIMASALYGVQNPGTGALRYGGAFGENNTYRIFTKYRHVDEIENLDGDDIPGALESSTLGFRTDMKPDQQSTLTVQSDLTAGSNAMSLAYPDMTPPPTMRAETRNTDNVFANVLGRYVRDLGGGSDIRFQGYYSWDEKRNDGWDLGIDTLDLDFQHQFTPLENHVAQWGVGFRHSQTSTRDYDPAFSFPDADSSSLYSAFLQDEISFADGAWVLTVGSKFERNDQTGLEFLPSARLLWHVTDVHALWGAVSRSVRTPSNVEMSAVYNIDGRMIPYEFPPNSGNYISVPLRTSMAGSEDVDAESILVYELGYRFTPSKTFYVDTSVYRAEANNLIAAAGTGGPYNTGAFLQYDATINNEESADIYGAEISATWVPLRWWKLQGWYAYYEDDYTYEGDGNDLFESTYGQISPRHQFFVRSSMDLPHDTELDIMGRYVSELPGIDVPDYATVDARLGWNVSKNVEIALVGKNLLEPRHPESNTNLVYGQSGVIERSCFLKLRVDF